VVEILDQLAPLRYGKKSQGKNGSRWLSNEAIVAKRLGRKLEHRWKSTGAETDRVEYRAACRTADVLINSSCNQHHHQRIVELKCDSRRTWSEVKMLLYGEASSPMVSKLIMQRSAKHLLLGWLVGCLTARQH